MRSKEMTLTNRKKNITVETNSDMTNVMELADKNLKQQFNYKQIQVFEGKHKYNEERN